MIAQIIVFAGLAAVLWGLLRLERCLDKKCWKRDIYNSLKVIVKSLE
jgi:hypothetical protein